MTMRAMLLGAVLAAMAGGIAAAQPAVQTGPAPATPQTATQTSNRTALSATPPSSAQAAHEMTAADLGSFFDGLVPYALARGDMAGGVITVVKGGQIVFAKGYGYADVKKRTPVIPNSTMFRPGSVSKLFTWTAVMQLVGEGKLDLHRDVNAYLDFKIPAKFGKPITLWNCLTHTPGLEDNFAESFVNSKKEMMPLGIYLKKHLPARIFPPGKIVAYSNYCASLSGYIVQRVSGEPYEQYIADHILKPLGMNHSTFVQPLPAALAPDMASGYMQASDDKTVPFEFVETAPAGALSSTGVDMAHFMMAHLNNGQYDGATILKPAIAKLMHSPQSAMSPGMNGFDLGFYQENRNGLRIIGHAGDTEAFHSDLHLLLDKDVGIFMSFNSLGKDGAAETVRTAIFRAFLDRYYPYTAPDEKTVANPKPDAARVAGWYQASRRNESVWDVLNALGQGSVTALPNGDVEVSMLTDYSGAPKHWREVGPLTYREVGGQTHLKFVTDKGGNVLYWISDDFIPVMIFQKVHGLAQLGVLKIMLALFVIVLALAIAIWFGGWIVRRRFHTALAFTREQYRLRLASRIGAVLLLCVIGIWAAILAQIMANNSALGGWLIAAYIIGVLGLLGALATLVEVAMRLARGPGGWLVKLGEAVLGLAAIYGIWLIFAFGLVNFSLNY